jgi:hypothetical protein
MLLIFADFQKALAFMKKTAMERGVLPRLICINPHNLPRTKSYPCLNFIFTEDATDF